LQIAKRGHVLGLLPIHPLEAVHRLLQFQHALDRLAHLAERLLDCQRLIPILQHVGESALQDSWQPAAEEGDDDPILGDEARERPQRPAPMFGGGSHAASNPAQQQHVPSAPRPEIRNGGSVELAESALPDSEFGEIYVNIGRREGARAADFLRLLTERAGIDKLSIRRIRVRERNAFVSVRKDDVAKAVAALTGATIAVSAELEPS